MGMRLTLYCDVLVVKIVQGLRDTALAEIVVLLDFAAASRQLGNIIEHVEVISNENHANYVYYSIS